MSVLQHLISSCFLLMALSASVVLKVHSPEGSLDRAKLEALGLKMKIMMLEISQFGMGGARTQGLPEGYESLTKYQ